MPGLCFWTICHRNFGARESQEHGLNTWDWQPKDIALLPFIRKSLCVQIQAKCQPVRALSSLAFVQCPKNCLGQIINKWQSCPWTQSLYNCVSSCLFGHSHFNSWEFILLFHSHPVWALYCVYIHTLNTEAAIKVTSDRGGYQPTRKIQTGNQVSHPLFNKIRWTKPLKGGNIRALSS